MNYLEIVDVQGREILDSRGNPITYADLTRSYWQQHFYGFGRIPYDP